MNYPKNKITAVNNLIDKYTNEYLDNYCKADIEQIAAISMENGLSPIEVANKVYDFTKSKYADNNIVYTVSIKQIMPTNILLVLRQEIIKLLK